MGTGQRRSAAGAWGRSIRKGEEFSSVSDHHAVVYELPSGVRVYAYCRTIGNCYNCYNENSSLILGAKVHSDLLNLCITGETNWSSSQPPSKNNA